MGVFLLGGGGCVVVVDGERLDGVDSGCVVMLGVESSGGGNALVMAVLVAFTGKWWWFHI